jgi:peptide deformylase
MSILKVARMGHPVLRERARPLDKSDLRNPLVQKLADDMVETMREYHGVGLAAPQVHESVRLFVALLDDEPDADSEATILINPEVISHGGPKERLSSSG